jgi:anthranilate phosphoribosyltransferase
VAEAEGGSVKTYEVSPREFGLAEVSANEMKGGEPEANAAILREVLGGKKGPHRDIVLLNAAPALIAGQAASDWASGLALAAKSIDSGAALATLEALVRVSHDS